ncbi:hypothetical protein ACJX0J_041839, partial [Zea mays]
MILFLQSLAGALHAEAEYRGVANAVIHVPSSLIIIILQRVNRRGLHGPVMILKDA